MPQQRENIRKLLIHFAVGLAAMLVLFWCVL